MDLSTLFKGGSGSFIVIIGMFVVIYLVLFLPESNRRKKLKLQISQMKPGDKVLTNSGIYGTIDFISDKSVYIKSLDSKLEVAKESIAAVLKNQ
jgi:preprotein translocase subunit YajC